ncbi:MAG TPA: hypothetical protein VF317_06285 [Dermatophilaceae bacterium]
MSAADERRALVMMSAAHRRDDAILRAVLHEVGTDISALHRLIVELACLASEYAADWHGEGLDQCLAAAVLDAAADEAGVAPLGGLL